MRSPQLSSSSGSRFMSISPEDEIATLKTLINWSLDDGLQERSMSISVESSYDLPSSLDPFLLHQKLVLLMEVGRYEYDSLEPASSPGTEEILDIDPSILLADPMKTASEGESDEEDMETEENKELDDPTTASEGESYEEGMETEEKKKPDNPTTSSEGESDEEGMETEEKKKLDNPTTASEGESDEANMKTEAKKKLDNLTSPPMEAPLTTTTHPNNRTFQCSHLECGRKFARKYDCKRHERIHSDELEYRCTISGCTSAFRRSDHLHNHMRRGIHGGKRPTGRQKSQYKKPVCTE